MGLCSSKEKTDNTININIYVFTAKTNTASQSLKDFYLSSGIFYNTYQPLNYGYLIGLNKFAQKVDPFMHYRGKSIKKKERLRRGRHCKTKDDLFLLLKTWELYLLSQRLADWGDVSLVKNKKKVTETIDLFLKTREEIIELLA
jgi:hypothetical protein